MDTWDLTTLNVEPNKPEVLRSDDGAARAIVINLPAGDVMQDHETYEHAWLHVHHGAIRVSQGRAGTEGRAGFVAHFAPHEHREITAVEDAHLLLVLAPWPGVGRDKDFNA